MAGLHTPSISLLYPSVPCAEQAELGEVPGVRQRTYGACNVHGLKDICLHQISALENKGTAWTLFITCLLCGTVLKCGIHLDLWADPCSKGCGSLDVDGWPDVVVVGRTFWSDRRERERERRRRSGIYRHLALLQQRGKWDQSEKTWDKACYIIFKGEGGG